MDNNKDVPEGEDLYKQLDEELAKGKEDDSSERPPEQSEKEEKPSTDADKPKEKEEDLAGDAELSEEEIAKLSPRAQKRIRDLAQKVKELATNDDKAEGAEGKDKPAQDFKSVQEFLSAVQDEPSRQLLEKFYHVVKGEFSSTLAPIERQNAEKQFEDFFGKYAEKIEGLSDLKDDLKKTYLRDPSQSLKALISEAATDLALNRVEKIEDEPSVVNRDEKPDLDSKSKDELYDLLDTLKD